MRRFLQTILVAIATLALLLLLWGLRDALILFVLSLAVASAIRGPADTWRKRGLPHGLGIVLTYVPVITALGIVIYIATGPVLRDLQQATDLFDRTYRQIVSSWPSGSPFQQLVAQQLPAPQDLYNAIAGEQGAQLLQNILGVASGFAGGLARFAVVLVLSIYWSIDRLYFERLWISLLPVDKRRRAREIWRELEDSVGGYIRSEVLQSVIAGFALGFGYYAMGLKFPALIAMIGALFWLIPWVGAGLAIVLPLLDGLAAGPALAIAAPLYTIAVLAFLEWVVEPRLFNRQRYSSLLIIIVLIAMTEAYGVMGLLLAPPLAAAIQTLYTSLVRTPPPLIQEDLVNKMVALRQRVTVMQERIADQAEEPSPEVVSLLGRLNTVLEQTDQYFDTGGILDPRLTK